MTQVTNLGFLRTRLDERLAQLQADYKAIYGDDIQIDPDDIDGQFIGMLSNAIADLDGLAEVVYHSFNPQSATGLALSRLVRLNGIRRTAGAFSMVDLTFTGQPGTVIPANSICKDPATGSKWYTLSEVVIPVSGTAIATARSEALGSTSAAAGAVSKIDTPVYGWQSVTNAQPATEGRSEETDEELRVRRAKSTNTPAQCIVDAVYGGIANLPNVRLVRVYENDQDVVDANGQAPHSIYCVVEGGDTTKIAQMIWDKKTAGTTTIGTSATNVKDSQGMNHVINFSRPVYTDAYIIVNITKRPGYPTDGTARIKAAMEEYGKTLGIGDPLLNSRLYNPANTVPNHYVTSIMLGSAPDPATENNMFVNFDGLIRIDAARIVVNEV